MQNAGTHNNPQVSRAKPNQLSICEPSNVAFELTSASGLLFLMGTLNSIVTYPSREAMRLTRLTRLNDKKLSEAQATFYITQRKLAFAPCLGHERLVRLLVDSQIDRPRLRFLEQDRGGLQLFAKAIEDMQFVGKIRAVRPATIVFAQQPFADITGEFGLTQAQEIKFQHAFDLPMTTASLALQFRMAAGENRWLSDFSLRRNGDIERAVDIANYAFIGGFNDTSNMEAAHRLDIPAVGTEAHYCQQLISIHDRPRSNRVPATQASTVAFELWMRSTANTFARTIDSTWVLCTGEGCDFLGSPPGLKGFRVDWAIWGTWSVVYRFLRPMVCADCARTSRRS